jgi:NH3-dependent NAD+ synthetase
LQLEPFVQKSRNNEKEILFWKKIEKIRNTKPKGSIYKIEPERELGFSYKEADEILQQWERGEALPDSPQVAKVLSLIEKSTKILGFQCWGVIIIHKFFLLAIFV